MFEISPNFVQIKFILKEIDRPTQMFLNLYLEHTKIIPIFANNKKASPLFFPLNESISKM